MSITDKALPMNQLGVAMVQDLGNVYQNQSSHEKGDLLTVWESMYEKGLHRKVSSQCYYTPEQIEEARRKEEAEKAANSTEKVKEDKIKARGEETGEEKKAKSQESGGEKRGKDDPEEECLEIKRDFASIHLERAANSSRAHWFNEGRSYRKRTFSNSSSGEPHDDLHH